MIMQKLYIHGNTKMYILDMRNQRTTALDDLVSTLHSIAADKQVMQLVELVTLTPLGANLC